MTSADKVHDAGQKLVFQLTDRYVKPEKAFSSKQRPDIFLNTQELCHSYFLQFRFTALRLSLEPG